MTTLETRRFAVISTAYVSETTAKRLDNTPPKNWPCLGRPYGAYGSFLYAHDENASVWPDVIIRHRFPQAHQGRALDAAGDIAAQARARLIP